MDASFGTNGAVVTSIGASSSVYGVAVQSDRKVVAGGGSIPTKQMGGDSGNFALARYHPDGSIDTSFGTAAR